MEPRILIGAIGFWLFAGGLGSKSTFFEEQVVRFEMQKNGEWSLNQSLNSNGEPPGEWKSKVKKAQGEGAS